MGMSETDDETALPGAFSTGISSTSLLSLMMTVRSTRRDLRWRRFSDAEPADLELDLDLDLDLDLVLPDLRDLLVLERCLEDPPALRCLLDLRLLMELFISSTEDA